MASTKFDTSKAFSGFSVDNSDKAKQFYGDVLGMDIGYVEGMEEMGMLELRTSGGYNILVYPKEDHTPASYTVLNFPVDNIDDAMDELKAKGVAFKHYNKSDLPQDEKGVLRGLSQNMGPDIAWFEDPAGNVLAVLQDSK